MKEAFNITVDTVRARLESLNLACCRYMAHARDSSVNDADGEITHAAEEMNLKAIDYKYAVGEMRADKVEEMFEHIKIMHELMLRAEYFIAPWVKWEYSLNDQKHEHAAKIKQHNNRCFEIMNAEMDRIKDEHEDRLSNLTQADYDRMNASLG